MAGSAREARFEVGDIADGVRLVTVPLAGRASVAIAFMVAVGSRYEPLAKSGISHFVEHMVFKGTSRYATPRELSETIEGVGGVLDAATDRESTVFWTRVPSPELERGVDVLSEMLLHPTIPDDEVVKERHVVIEELRMYQDNPQDLVQIAFDEVMWPDHPLGRDVAGHEESVRAFSADDCREHMATHVRPETLVISVAGAVSQQRLRRLLEKRLATWPDGAGPRSAPEPAKPANGERLRVVRRRAEQANVVIGARAPSYFDPDRFVVDILNIVLGEGMSSRLFLELRERRGLVYDVHSFVNRLSDTGVLGIGFGSEPRNARSALRLAVSELERLASEHVPAPELTKAREYAKGRLLLHLEGTSALCEYAGHQMLLTGEILAPSELAARYDAVTAADVQRVAASILRQGLRGAVVGPFQSASRFEAALLPAA